MGSSQSTGSFRLPQFATPNSSLGRSLLKQGRPQGVSHFPQLHDISKKSPVHPHLLKKKEGVHKDFILKNIANSVAISRKVANRVAERLGEEAKPERATKHNRVGRVDFFIEERKNDKERRERE